MNPKIVRFILFKHMRVIMKMHNKGMEMTTIIQLIIAAAIILIFTIYALNSGLLN